MHVATGADSRRDELPKKSDGERENEWHPWFYAVAYGDTHGIFLSWFSAMQAAAGDRAALMYRSPRFRNAYEWYCEQRQMIMEPLARPHYVVYGPKVFWTERRSDLREFIGPSAHTHIEVVFTQAEAESLVERVSRNREAQRQRAIAEEEARRKLNAVRLRELKRQRAARDASRREFRDDAVANNGADEGADSESDEDDGDEEGDDGEGGGNGDHGHGHDGDDYLDGETPSDDDEDDEGDDDLAGGGVTAHTVSGPRSTRNAEVGQESHGGRASRKRTRATFPTAAAYMSRVRPRGPLWPLCTAHSTASP